MLRDNAISLREGDLYHGRYRILRCIEADSTGAAYDAVDTMTNARHILKVVSPGTTTEAADSAQSKIAPPASDNVALLSEAGLDKNTKSVFMSMGVDDDFDGNAVTQLYDPPVPETGLFEATLPSADLAQPAVSSDKNAVIDPPLPPVTISDPPPPRRRPVTIPEVPLPRRSAPSSDAPPLRRPGSIADAPSLPPRSAPISDVSAPRRSAPIPLPPPPPLTRPDAASRPSLPAIPPPVVPLPPPLPPPEILALGGNLATNTTTFGPLPPPMPPPERVVRPVLPLPPPQPLATPDTPEAPRQLHPNRFTSKHFGVAAIVIAIGGLAYFFFHRDAPPMPTNTPATTPAPAEPLVVAPEPTANGERLGAEPKGPTNSAPSEVNRHEQESIAPKTTPPKTNRSGVDHGLPPNTNTKRRRETLY